MRFWHGGRPQLSGPQALAGTLCAALFVAALVMVGLPGTAALFTADYPHSVNIAASRIYRDERVTPAFAVSDHSSGSAVDQSSANAFAGDGRQFVSRAWTASFTAGRYLELDFNAPLPAGLAVSSASLSLRAASDAGSGSLCLYVELRRVSSGALLSSHGSSGSPLACTSGSSYLSLSVPAAAVASTDIANDVRVRVYASDSAAGALRLDQATLIGDTPYTTFALYPVLTRELVSGATETIPWGMGGS